MIIPIKGIKKWRIAHDDLCWVIQERMPKQKPPNDWRNRYWCTTLESVFKTLVDLGIDPQKLINIKGAVHHVAALKRNLLDAIQEIFEKTSGDIPETERIKAVRSAIKKHKKKK